MNVGRHEARFWDFVTRIGLGLYRRGLIALAGHTVGVLVLWYKSRVADVMVELATLV